jgi:hypothetical protein
LKAGCRLESTTYYAAVALEDSGGMKPLGKRSFSEGASVNLIRMALSSAHRGSVIRARARYLAITALYTNDRATSDLTTESPAGVRDTERYAAISVVPGVAATRKSSVWSFHSR